MESEAAPRRVKKADSQKSAGAYRALEALLHKSGRSLSEYFALRLKEGKPLRRRTEYLESEQVDHAVPRFLVKDDFERIWTCQEAGYPELHNIRQQVFELIFNDRPHAPYATGICTLLPHTGEKRLPRMHRLAEMRRIYEQVNNLRYLTSSGEYPLTRPMRDALAAYLLEGKNLNATSIKAQLKQFTDEKVLKVNLPDEARQIRGFSHVAAFGDLPAWQRMNEAERDEFVSFVAEPRLNPEDENSCLMPDEMLIGHCCQRLGLPQEEGRELTRRLLSLPKDRSSLGLTATTQLLELLREGNPADEWRPLSNREAADLCGMEAAEERMRALAGKCDALPYYGEALIHDITPVHPWHTKSTASEELVGRVPNPVVHVALNQLRKVVNEIVARYGKPQRIHVELAREFGMSARKREELQKEQKKREAENAVIDQALIGLGLRPERWNRIKYRLWKEQGCQDVYSFQAIPASALSSCEIDHIVPQSRGGTDTYANLALTFAQNNREKSDDFAFDFIQRRHADAWPHILEHINRKEYPAGKRWRFMQEAADRFQAEGDDEQTDRRLTDTSYMSKLALRYLSLLCRDVIPVRGALTARLRHQWGLDGLEYELAGENTPREIVDPESGEVKPNPVWFAKPRIDHRHHALDAAVLACVSRSLVLRMILAEKQGKRALVPPPFGDHTADFRQSMLRMLLRIRVSPKPEHGMSGPLHNATAYRIIACKGEDMYLTKAVKKLVAVGSLTELEKKQADTEKLCQDGEAGALLVRDAAQGMLQAIASRMEEARQQLEAEARLAESQAFRPKKVDDKQIFQRAVKLARKARLLRGTAFPYLETKTLVNIRTSLQCGYRPDSNSRMDFFETNKGTVGWECLRLFDVNQKGFEPEWKKAGHKLLWSVFRGDVLEMDISPEMLVKYKVPGEAGKRLFVVQQLSNAILAVMLLNEARALQAKDNTDQKGRWTSGNTGLVFFTKGQARKLDLTPFGGTLHKHCKLWYGARKKS